MESHGNLYLDTLRRRYSSPFESLDSKYESGFSKQKLKNQPSGLKSSRSSLLSKVEEDDESENLDPFEEFHLTPEKRILRSVNNLRWRVDGSGRNRAQSLIDGFIDQVDTDDGRRQNNAFLGIHHMRRRRRNRRRWSIFPDDENEEGEGERIKLPPIQRWRRTARIVRMLCAVCIALRKYAMDAGLMENYMVNVTRKARTSSAAGGGGGEGSGEGGGGPGDTQDELTFNLKDFKVRKELNVPLSIIRMMEKNPDDRTEAELVSIGRMMKNLPSFRKYTSNMQRLFCKIVRYTKCGKRRIVLRKGHLGYNLYFIYSGAVSVVLDKDEGNVFVKPEVVVLRKGACFGEIALLQQTRRNATVVCTEESELLFVEKEDFLDNGLHLAMDEEFEQRYNFFRTWKALESWSDQKVKDLSYVSRMEEFNHNKVIVKDSKKNEWLWFIIRGSCDVLRLVDLEKCPEYRKVMLQGHNIEDYLMENSGKKKQQPQRNRLRSSSSRSSGSRLMASTPDIRIHEPKEDKAKNSGASLLSSEAVLSKSSIGSSMYSQGTSEETEPELVESESEDDDLIPKGATVKEINPMDQGSSFVKSLNIGQGIFVKVDELRDGQCFGIEYLFDDVEKPVTLSLVSKGCEVIHVPRSRFQEMAEEQSLTHILHKGIKTYPDDNTLCARFLEINQWDSYKTEVIGAVRAAQSAASSYQDSLRANAKRREFQRLCDGLKDPGPVRSRTTLALYDANHNASLERPDGGHFRRSITSTGMRDDRKEEEAAARIRGTSAESGRDQGRRRQRPRPRTCPAGLRNNRLTNRTQFTTHRTITNSSSNASNGLDRSSNEARTSRLVALTIKSRSNKGHRPRSKSPSGRVLITKSGYKVKTTPVLASGSQRTIQLVESVRSPEHEYRMRMVKQH